MKLIIYALSIVLLIPGVMRVFAQPKDAFFIRLEGPKSCSILIDPFAKKHTKDEVLILDYAVASAIAQIATHGSTFTEKNIDSSIPFVVALGQHIYTTQCQCDLPRTNKCIYLQEAMLALAAYPSAKKHFIAESREEFLKLKKELPSEYLDAEVVVGFKFKVPSDNEIAPQETPASKDGQINAAPVESTSPANE